MRNQVLSSWISISLALATAAAAEADDGAPEKAVDPLLINLQRLAEGSADPVRAVDAARERLLQNIDRLEQFLAGGGAERASGWSEWLAISRLKSELSSANPDLEALQSLQERFYENRLGLELPVFVAVRRELRAFIAASEYARVDSHQEHFRQRLLELGECLARLDAQPTESDAYRASTILKWLESVDADGARLAREARQRLCRTNAVVQASGRLANVLLQRNVRERNYIAEMVLGSFMRGVAFTEGQVLFRTVPSDDQGKFQIHLQGQVLCPANVAERRRISVYSSANTTIDARKLISIDDQGLHLGRAQAFCATNLEIQDIDARLRFVERVSWRRANQMVPEAEGLASQRAQSEAAYKLDQQADTALGGVNSTFCEKLRMPLIRMDAFPASIRVWTDAEHFRLSLSQHNELQLAAASEPPSLSKTFDIGGSVHESMINNVCESLLGGRTLQDRVWLDMMQIITGTPPRPLWVHDRAERWAVRFAKQRPAIARFEQDRLDLTLRLIELKRGDITFKRPIEIQARFILRITQEGPELVREGDLMIRFSDEMESGSDAAHLDFLARKFGAVFPPILAFTGLVPPDGGSLGKLRSLQTAEFDATNGWLTLAYELAP